MKLFGKEPELGETKIIKKFAFFPKKVRNKTIWLEFYEEELKFDWHNAPFPTWEAKYRIKDGEKFCLKCKGRHFVAGKGYLSVCDCKLAQKSMKEAEEHIRDAFRRHKI